MAFHVQHRQMCPVMGLGAVKGTRRAVLFQGRGVSGTIPAKSWQRPCSQLFGMEKAQEDRTIYRLSDQAEG